MEDAIQARISPLGKVTRVATALTHPSSVTAILDQMSQKGKLVYLFI